MSHGTPKRFWQTSELVAAWGSAHRKGYDERADEILSELQRRGVANPFHVRASLLQGKGLPPGVTALRPKDMKQPRGQR